jgi:DNA-binding MarR family transcriptional regulator
VSTEEYETLAAFRHALARFLGFSEAAAAAAGLTPRQYQALLAMKGNREALSIGNLAERLQIHHHSAVGLVDRLEAMGLATRAVDPGDRRRIHVKPTPKGERQVARLAAVHRDELKERAETLSRLLRRLARPVGSGRGRRSSA